MLRIGSGLDTAGLFVGSDGTTGLDLLAVEAVVRRFSAARTLLDRASTQARRNEAQLLRAVMEQLDATSQTERIGMLDSAFAAFDLAKLDEAAVDERTDLERAMAVSRHLPGISLTRELALIWPVAVFSRGPLLLPHLGLLLDNLGGTTACVMVDGSTAITWETGRRLTMPATGLPVGATVAGIARARTAGATPVLNDCAAIADAFRGWQPAEGKDLDEAAAILSTGLELLHWAWPAAGEMADRLLRGVLLLRARSGTRSHSPESLAGGVVMTAVDPVSTGDLLCHELAHVRLNLILAADPIIDDDGEAIHRSPWRPDLRPIRGILLGAHAFVDVCNYYRRLIDRGIATNIAEAIYQRQRENVREALRLLEASAKPTEGGRRVLDELAQEASRL